MTPAKQMIENEGGWKGIAIKWMVNQSVPTILLFGILGFLVEAGPAIMADQKEQRADFSRIEESIRTESREDNKQIFEAHQKHQQELTRAMAEMTSALRALELRIQGTSTND